MKVIDRGLFIMRVRTSQAKPLATLLEQMHFIATRLNRVVICRHIGLNLEVAPKCDLDQLLTVYLKQLSARLRKQELKRAEKKRRRYNASQHDEISPRPTEY